MLYSGWWWLTAREFKTRINGFIASEQAKGARIAPATVKVRGYPFSFRIKFEGASLGWPSGFGFTGENVKIRAWPWSLRHIGVVTTGGFSFILPPGDSRPVVTIAGETLRGNMAFRDSAVPVSLKMTADGISASEAAQDGKPGPEVTVATVELTESRPEMMPASDMDVAYDASVRLLDLSGRSLESNPLGGTIQEVLIHAKLLGIPPATTDSAGLRAWRDSGGTIDAPDLALRWGALTLTGNGTVALDNEMQPEGAFTAHLSGFEQAIDALTAAGWVKMGPGSIAKIALGISAHPSPDGKPTVDTPLTIQNRRLSIGPAKLTEIPVLRLD